MDTIKKVGKIVATKLLKFLKMILAPEPSPKPIAMTEEKPKGYQIRTKNGLYFGHIDKNNIVHFNNWGILYLIILRQGFYDYLNENDDGYWIS